MAKSNTRLDGEEMSRGRVMFATSSHMIAAGMEVAMEGVPVLEGPEVRNPYLLSNSGPATLSASQEAVLRRLYAKAVEQDQESQLEGLMERQV